MTAVTGSNAPVTAAGVEPASFIETFIKTSDNTVGKKPKNAAQNTAEMFGKICRALPSPKNEYKTNIGVAKSVIKKVNLTLLILTFILLTATI